MSLPAKRTKLLEEKKQGKLYLYNDTPVQILKGSGVGLTDVVLTPRGSIVAAVSENAGMHLWNRETSEYSSHALPGFMPVNLQFSPDGKTLAFISSLSLYLWDVDKARVQMELVNVQEYAFSADGKGLFCYKRESTRELYYYDLFQNKRTFSVPVSGFLLYNLSLAGNGSMLVGACSDERIRLWSCADFEILMELKTGPDRIFLTAFANDTVAYSGNNGVIHLKSTTNSDAPPVLLKDHRDMVYKLLFHKEYLLSSNEDGTVRIWKGGKEYAKFEEPRGKSIQGMDLSPDGQHLAHTTEGGDIYLYDLGTFLES